MTAIAVKDLQFAYPKGGFRLDVGTFSLDEGETVALVGMSGSGKTTLANLISGILIPQRGDVSVGGTALNTLPDAARRAFRVSKIGYVFQDLGLLDYLTAEENILLPYTINRSLQLSEESQERARTLATELRLSHRLTAKPSQLSGGEQQRVALARALVTTPSIVIADEPTGNLDPATAAQTVDLILSSVSKEGASLLTITHDPVVAARHDRTVSLEELMP